MREIKLLYISPDSNSNKFYNMTELGNGNFKAEWGRVGSKGSTIEYPMRDWDDKLREKKRKGYNDVTTDNKVVRIGDTKGLESLNPKVKDLLERLNKHAKEAFKLNYTVEIQDVSEVLVHRAQDIIDDINKDVNNSPNYHTINSKLLKLYNTIPRKIKNVRESLVPGPIDNDDMLSKVKDKMAIEQGLIDVIKGQLNNAKPVDATDPNNSKVLSFLDQLGLDIEEVTPQEETMLKDMMTDSSSKYITAYKVTNFKTQKAFDEDLAKSKNKKTTLLFHGSRSENWLNIVKHGLVLHPDAVTSGKLFDNGIYFADIADKSLGYISGGRWNSGNKDSDNWLAVYDVHTGKQCTYKDLKGQHVNLAKFVPDNNYDSYWAKRDIEGRYSLRRDEFIVYEESKATIKYLIHI